MPDDAALLYFVGETVILHARISKPGTKTPLDPTDPVVLQSLLRTDVSPAVTVTVSNPDYTHNATGDWTLALDTTAMAAGAYKAITKVSSGSSAVKLLVDQFVLIAP